MNKYNGFDDNSCRCHQPKEQDCTDREHSFCCTNCLPGPLGPQGPAGGVLNYADFYGLMPPDSAATVAPGTDVSFPQDGPNSGSGIARSDPDSFNLAGN